MQIQCHFLNQCFLCRFQIQMLPTIMITVLAITFTVLVSFEDVNCGYLAIKLRGNNNQLPQIKKVLSKYRNEYHNS